MIFSTAKELKHILLDYVLDLFIFVATNASMVFLPFLIESVVADLILKQLVIIYSNAPILQMKDQYSWTLVQQ